MPPGVAAAGAMGGASGGANAATVAGSVSAAAAREGADAVDADGVEGILFAFGSLVGQSDCAEQNFVGRGFVNAAGVVVASP